MGLGKGYIGIMFFEINCKKYIKKSITFAQNCNTTFIEIESY